MASAHEAVVLSDNDPPGDGAVQELQVVVSRRLGRSRDRPIIIAASDSPPAHNAHTPELQVIVSRRLGRSRDHPIVIAANDDPVLLDAPVPSPQPGNLGNPGDGMQMSTPDEGSEILGGPLSQMRTPDSDTRMDSPVEEDSGARPLRRSRRLNPTQSGSDSPLELQSEPEDESSCPYDSASQCLLEFTRPYRNAWTRRFEFIAGRLKEMEFCFTGVPLYDSGKDLVWWMLQLLDRRDRSLRKTVCIAPWQCQVHIPRRYTRLMRGKRVLELPVLKAMALNDMERAAAFIEKDWSISHLEDIPECMDIRHYGLEESDTNQSRRACFERALEQYENGQGIPRHCNDERHAHDPCELQSHTESHVFPLSRLIKEVAFVRFDTWPESLSAAQIREMRHLLGDDGQVLPWSLLDQKHFTYVRWDQDLESNIRQRAEERRLPLPQGPSIPTTLREIRAAKWLKLSDRIDLLKEGALD